MEWAAWSAGYEAGLRDGIATTDLRVTVEVAAAGPAIAGLRLWRTVIAARLQPSATYRTPALSGEQLRANARASWELNTDSSTGADDKVVPVLRA